MYKYLVSCSELRNRFQPARTQPSTTSTEPTNKSSNLPSVKSTYETAGFFTNRLFERSTNDPTNQPANKSSNQQTNLPFDKTTNEPAAFTTNPPTNQPTNEAANHPLD
jgi:hypothetical protein